MKIHLCQFSLINLNQLTARMKVLSIRTKKLQRLIRVSPITAHQLTRKKRLFLMRSFKNWFWPRLGLLQHLLLQLNPSLQPHSRCQIAQLVSPIRRKSNSKCSSKCATASTKRRSKTTKKTYQCGKKNMRLTNSRKLIMKTLRRKRNLSFWLKIKINSKKR